MIQAADGDVPWEINPQHSQGAPEILIMPQKRRETRKKEKVRNAVTLIIYEQQQSNVFYFS